MAAERPTSHDAGADVPALRRTRQLLIVAAEDWHSASAKMWCFERADHRSAWREASPASRAVLGRAGLAWGVGLHTAAAGGPLKREGDGKAPAGVFSLVEAFGFASAKDARLASFPYRQLTESTEGIDDSASRHYNRIVDASTVAVKDWNSSEKMRRIDLYRWGAVVGHNWQQKPHAGSCIFLHVWEADGVPTSGCTAVSEEEMLRMLRWLDWTKHPLLVQLPAAEYRQLRTAWKLPNVPL